MFSENLDPVLPTVRAEPDRLVFQIVGGADKTHRATLRPHQDRVSRRACALRSHPAQHRAVTDAGRAKDDVLSVRQIVGEKDAPEIGRASCRERVSLTV